LGENAAQGFAQGLFLPKICPRKILVLSQNDYIIGFVVILLLKFILRGFDFQHGNNQKL
jgi:hypothetical protein